MCTCIAMKTRDVYFGRTLDLQYRFGEKVAVTPRNYPFTLRSGETFDTWYAMVGMARVEQDYPLYAEATNEKGLSMAGLYFPGNAVYGPHGLSAPVLPDAGDHPGRLRRGVLRGAGRRAFGQGTGTAAGSGLRGGVFAVRGGRHGAALWRGAGTSQRRQGRGGALKRRHRRHIGGKPEA